MSRRRPGGAPAVAAAALLLAAAGSLTVPQARAAVPAGPDLTSRQPADVPDAPGLRGTVRLAPALAAALGAPDLDAAGARTLAARRTAGPAAAGATAGPGTTPEVGVTRLWPVADFRSEVPVLSLRPFALRAVSPTAEVWVAGGPEGTSFAPGDCRNDTPEDVEVTDAQAQALAREFDAVIHPRETKAFSSPVERDGSRTVPGLAAAGLDFGGDGRKTVLLVDNIRDAGYDNVGDPGVSGYFTPIYTSLTDRNVVTVDSFDWRHRTGANPPDDPTDDLCTSRSGLPRYIESTIAHEWYHLLENDRDPLEPLWVDEGMAEYAMSVAGYPRTRATIAQRGAERELMCFQGFGTTKGPSNAHPVACGGPQNSLTVWEDEGAGHELLADYGNAWSFFLFLADRYGADTMRAIHLDRSAQGLTGVARALGKKGSTSGLRQVLHDFRLMNLLDRLADTRGAQVRGIEPERVRTRSLSAALDLANPAAYANEGAGPNGGDYVSLGSGRALRSLTFAGREAEVDSADAAAAQLLDPLLEPVGIPVGIARTPGLWTVDVVGLDRAHARALVLTFQGDAFTLSAAQRQALAAYPQVVAVVGYDRVTGRADEPGRYALTLNGTVAAGG